MVLRGQHQTDIQWSTGFLYILIKLSKLETVQTCVNNSMQYITIFGVKMTPGAKKQWIFEKEKPQKSLIAFIFLFRRELCGLENGYAGLLLVCSSALATGIWVQGSSVVLPKPRHMQTPVIRSLCWSCHRFPVRSWIGRCLCASVFPSVK